MKRGSTKVQHLDKGSVKINFTLIREVFKSDVSDCEGPQLGIVWSVRLGQAKKSLYRWLNKKLKMIKGAIYLSAPKRDLYYC